MSHLSPELPSHASAVCESDAPKAQVSWPNRRPRATPCPGGSYFWRSQAGAVAKVMEIIEKFTPTA
jgi:hypothetical protein